MPIQNEDQIRDARIEPEFSRDDPDPGTMCDLLSAISEWAGGDAAAQQTFRYLFRDRLNAAGFYTRGSVPDDAPIDDPFS